MKHLHANCHLAYCHVVSDPVELSHTRSLPFICYTKTSIASHVQSLFSLFIPTELGYVHENGAVTVTLSSTAVLLASCCGVSAPFSIQTHCAAVLLCLIISASLISQPNDRNLLLLRSYQKFVRVRALATPIITVDTYKYLYTLDTRISSARLRLIK